MKIKQAASYQDQVRILKSKVDGAGGKEENVSGLQ